MKWPHFTDVGIAGGQGPSPLNQTGFVINKVHLMYFFFFWILEGSSYNKSVVVFAHHDQNIDGPSNK